MREFDIGLLEVEMHRRREVAQQRGHRRGRNVLEDEALRGLGQRQQLCTFGQRVAAIGQHQADRHRNVQWPCVDRHARFLEALLVGGGRQRLRQGQRVAPRRGVPCAFGFQVRRAGTGIPAAELAEVDTRCILHRGDEIIAGHGLPVVPLEVEVHALAESLAAEQRVDHAHDFGAFFVHRRGVEIVDLGVGRGTNRMRHRPGILGELAHAQAAHFLDARDGTRMHVGAEFLIAKHREAFLERELEPVAAGDAVAGPVVEVLVSDDAIDVLVVHVGRGVGAGQHVLGVEDVEALVLHRPHVEVAHRDDHVVVEVHLQAEALLVPGHGFLQRRQGVAALIELARFDMDRKADLAPGARDEAVFEHIELRRDEGKQVGRLGVGIFPARPVTLGIALADTGRDEIAVAQQLREALALGLDGAGVARHHVGSVGEEGDAAEALGLALGEVAVLRTIEAGELGVLVRLDAHHGFEHEGIGQGRGIGAEDAQRIVGQGVARRRQRLAIEADGAQGKLLAMQHQRAAGPARIALARQCGADFRVAVVDRDMEIDRVDQPGRRPEVDGVRCFGAHEGFGRSPGMAHSSEKLNAEQERIRRDGFAAKVGAGGTAPKAPSSKNDPARQKNPGTWPGLKPIPCGTGGGDIASADPAAFEVYAVGCG